MEFVRGWVRFLSSLVFALCDEGFLAPVALRL